MQVAVYAERGVRLPEKATVGSAAYDVRAFLPIDTQVLLRPGDQFAVPTGLYFAIPSGYVISLRPRSGLAAKHGVTLINSPATIDSDYRGELKVLMINHGKEPFVIQNHDRIAQLMLEQTIPVEWQSVSKEELGITDRSSGGFGSTGLA